MAKFKFYQNEPKTPTFHDAKDYEMYWKWRDQFVEGEPKATENYSSKELKERGLIGLYKKEEK